jgi:hypothetical protein
VIKEHAEKILQYKDLTIQIQRVCNVKTKLIRVMIGATGTSSKSLRKYLNNRPGKHEIKELQNSHVGHSTRTSGSTNVNVQNIKLAK